MTTTISPSLGHAVWTQQGTGTSPGYDAIDVRRGFDDPQIGEGVTSYGSYRISQRAASANMSVDINMDDYAYVRGDAVSLQACYKIAPHPATINETITAADASNPRIDRVILEVKDHQHDSSGSNLAQTRIVAGTPTAGATLDNLNGAAAVPSSALLLADVLVAATDTAISDSEIRDRRSFVVGVPPLLTDVDMVIFEPAAGLLAAISPQATILHTSMDGRQAAVLMRLPRRIASATRIRWKYQQQATANTGNYVIAVYDSSGRKIVDTGTVGFTGAANSWQVRSETITATTFEPGLYYVAIGVDTAAVSGESRFAGVLTALDTTSSRLPTANLALYSTSGGVTLPTTILAFTDVGGLTVTDQAPGVPIVGLSVG